MAGAGAFLLGSMLSSRGSTTETQTNVAPDLQMERVEPKDIELMIGKDNMAFLRRHESKRFRFTNMLTGKPIVTGYNSGEYFVSSEAVFGMTSKTTTQPRNVFGLF